MWYHVTSCIFSFVTGSVCVIARTGACTIKLLGLRKKEKITNKFIPILFGIKVFNLVSSNEKVIFKISFAVGESFIINIFPQITDSFTRVKISP